MLLIRRCAKTKFKSYGDSTFNTEEFAESLHIYEILTSTTAYTYNSDLVFVEDAALNID